MKTKQITIEVCEVGDVIDISKITARIHKPAMNEGDKAVVIAAEELKRGGISYDVLTNLGHKVKIKPEEISGAEYVGHIDLTLLTND